jgi:type I restriction enzyme S subunit
MMKEEMTNDELPEGWTEAPFSELTVDPVQRVPASTEEITYIDIGSVDRDTKTITQPQTMLGKDAPSRARKVIKTGDVLVSTVRPNLNAVALVDRQHDGQFASTGFDVLRSPVLDPRWVFYSVRTPAFVERMTELVQGALYPAVRSKDVRAFTIPIAPLAEQKRIADKLEAVLGRVDACRARLDRVPDLLKRFRQSVLAAATSGQLTEDWREKNECVEDASSLLGKMALERREVHAKQGGNRKYREAEPVADEALPEIPTSWCWTNFDNCSSDISVGYVGPMKDRYVGEGTAFLRCQNVRPLRFDPRGLVHIPPDFHAQLSKSKLCGGEILVVRSGANTGDCCVFPRTFGEANCSDLVITRPLSGLCSEYGALYVNSPTGQSLLDQKQAGVAQPHFNIGAMRVKAFPLAPLPEQVEIVRRVEALFALADRIEARLTAARAQVERLTPATLAKAFRGDLVPQDPNDEPASQLLERIRIADKPASTKRR